MQGVFLCFLLFLTFLLSAVKIGIMKKDNLVIFDLDGTLLDTGRGITETISYVLGLHGIIETDRAVLNRFIGPPLVRCFEEWYGFSHEDAMTLLYEYRDYYTSTGMYHNDHYPGITALLSGLRDAGCTLAVATGKPEYLARDILEREGMSDYFAFIGGCTIDEKRTDKKELIEYVLENLGLSGSENVIMIGDRHSDIDGAHRAGYRALAALWGYGSRGEMTEACSDYYAETPEDVLSVIRHMI